MFVGGFQMRVLIVPESRLRRLLQKVVEVASASRVPENQ